jgi:hypothetical protein
MDSNCLAAFSLALSRFVAERGALTLSSPITGVLAKAKRWSAAQDDTHRPPHRSASSRTRMPPGPGKPFRIQR